MSCKMTIEQICGAVESPLFDRKSARIDAKALAVHLIAFANADGGVIAVGVEDDGTITGIDSYAENINELLRAPFDFCKPSVRVETERLSCTNRNGKADHILLIEVLQSSDLHANQADEVFFRVGDKSKKLNFEERLQLMYAKGTRYFEDTPVPDAGLDDLDLGFVREFTSRIGYRKSPEEYLRENKEFLSERSGEEEVSAAAMLLFGKNPKHFFPRARIRFVRYEGTEARVGARMNVIKDVMFEGRILQVTEKALEFVGSQIKERTYLGADTRFVTEPEYPEFAWKELIINAVAHRDYSIKGTDIQIKMVDDRITVESPGTLWKQFAFFAQSLDMQPMGVFARDMSLSLGQSESYINKIENKRTLPSMTGFFYICDYLNITPQEFFSTDAAAPQKSKELLREIERLSPEQAEHILLVVRDIIKKQ